MRFRLNNGQTSRVELRQGLGGAAMAPPRAPPENKRRIPREYEENTNGIRREYDGNTLAPPMHLACKWLVGGFGVALGGFARLFCILHSAFCLRLRVAFGGFFPGCPFRLASFCPPRNLQVFSQPSTFDLRPSTLAAAQPPRVGAEGGILPPFIADWKAPLPQNLPPALRSRTARSVTSRSAPRGLSILHSPPAIFFGCGAAAPIRPW